MIGKAQIDAFWLAFETKENKHRKKMFKDDAKRYGELTAIYNLGFLMGWDDRDQKKEE
jgi:hypothetical protein